MGGPASGKSTQSKIILENYRFLHVNGMDLVREKAASGTEHGKMIEEKLAKGESVTAVININKYSKRASLKNRNFSGRYRTPDKEKNGRK